MTVASSDLRICQRLFQFGRFFDGWSCSSESVCTFFFAAYLQIQLPSTHFIAQGVIGSIGSRFRACRLPSRILIRPEETDKSFFRK